MIVYVAHNLKFFPITFQIIKDKIFSLGSDVGDSASNWCLFFKEFSLLNSCLVFSNELAKGKFNVEFMRIRICLWWFFEVIDHFGSVFIILSWIKNFNFFLFFVLYLSFLFGLFFGFLSGEAFLFFESFLLIFTKFLSLLTLSVFIFKLFFVLSGRLCLSFVSLDAWFVLHVILVKITKIKFWWDYKM